MNPVSSSVSVPFISKLTQFDFHPPTLTQCVYMCRWIPFPPDFSFNQLSFSYPVLKPCSHFSSFPTFHQLSDLEYALYYFGPRLYSTHLTLI